MALHVQLLSPLATVPKRASSGAAGYDLTSVQDMVIPPNERAIVKTGLAITVPHGTYGRVAPRSGLAVKAGIHVGAGVIDEDYRGEVGIVLFNLSQKPFEVFVRDRVAQLILEKCEIADVVVVDSLSSTDRGAGGFGSTGV